ncbi:hypothetical protein [Enterococcus sp. 12E11_DIV0728]|uniref:hypothetical protein n=1 Tax=Enterococcus sp. 12E11_DIV0728 TaxID=1834168 RepID=UPI000A332D54|nr:hypothetical protein [Enterococcus sp. 12E11_DIV0728]OTO65582.1 hypothetical protein A5865_003646 [Enterococcus sp. 12E11_DIV0728]
MKLGEEFKMSGLSILGICLILLGICTVIYGGFLFPLDFLNSEFMSMVIGGLVLVCIGVFLVSEINPIFKILVIWITAILSLIYIYGFEMDFIVKLMSYIPIIGLAVWLTLKLLK